MQAFLTQSHGTEHVMEVKAPDGTSKAVPADIREVFGLFFEQLHNNEDARTELEPAQSNTELTAVSVPELTAAIRRLKAMKAGADDDLVAENRTTEYDGLLDARARCFLDSLSGQGTPPDFGKRVKLKVAVKKCDPKLPQHHMPISISRVMSKLFSTMLYVRSRNKIDEQLDREKSGLRAGQGCSDAIRVLRRTVETSLEVGLEPWLAALDVERTFDMEHHPVLSDALMNAKADANVISALRFMHTDMTAYTTVETSRDPK